MLINQAIKDPKGPAEVIQLKEDEQNTLEHRGSSPLHFQNDGHFFGMTSVTAPLGAGRGAT